MALMETLQDPFSGGSLDTVLWTDTSYSGGTVAVSGGFLACSPLPNAGNTSGNITSASAYDLTGSFAFINTTQIVAQNGSTYFYVQSDLSNRVYFRVFTGNISVHSVTAGFDFEQATDTYNASTHAWWRIRESGGTSFFDTSPDGKTWTNFVNFLNLIAVTSMKANLEGYDFSADTAPGSAKFVNFNLLPTTKTPFMTTNTRFWGS